MARLVMKKVGRLQPFAGFDAAALLGGFSAAACGLGTIQLAVTRQIRALALNLGRDFFTTR